MAAARAKSAAFIRFVNDDHNEFSAGGRSYLYTVLRYDSTR